MTCELVSINRKGVIIPIPHPCHERVAKTFIRIFVSGGKCTNLSRVGFIFGDGIRGESHISGRFVYITDVNRERSPKGERSFITRFDTDRITCFALKIKARVGFELIAINHKGAVIAVTATRYQRIGKTFACIFVSGGKRADESPIRFIFGDGIFRKRQISGRFVYITDVNRERFGKG